MLPNSGCQLLPLSLPLHAGTKSHLTCSFTLSKWAPLIPLFYLKWNHWITSLIVGRFSSMIPSPLPHPPYKKWCRPIKSDSSLTIHRRIHSLPYFGFLLYKNLLSPELKSPALPLLVACLYLSLRHLELRSVRSSKSLSSSPSIHSKLPCITTTTCSNFDKFLSSEVHHKPNARPTSSPHHFSYENKSKLQKKS
jgi:hypothetical protein